MKNINGTEDNKVVTSEIDITTHRVDELIVQFNPEMTEADRTYACLYQNQISRFARMRELEAELAALKHETKMSTRQLIAWKDKVESIRDINECLETIHGEGWNRTSDGDHLSKGFLQ